jgi:hypothetical protein
MVQARFRHGRFSSKAARRRIRNMKSMRPVEVAAAALCLAPWVVFALAQPDFQDSDDAWLLPLWVGGGVLAGFLSRSWTLAVLLGLLATGGVLLGSALQPCVEVPGTECDVNWTALVLLYFLPLTLLMIGAGVLLRRALGFVAARMR